MNNNVPQSNNVPQGLITNEKVSDQPKEAETPKKKLKINFTNKGNSKIIIAVVVVIFGAFILHSLLSGKKIGIFNKGNQEQTREHINVEGIDTNWGKMFADEAQNLYDDQGIDKFDIAFLNIDFLDEPEMVIRYLDKNEKPYLVVYTIDNNTDKVKKSKNFSDANLVLMYSLKEGDYEWYLNIASGKKYGTYTRFSKIINGTVKATDEDVRTDKALNEFYKNYVISDYKLTMYEVNLDEYAKDFKTMYDRFSKYDQEIYDKAKELEKNHSNEVIIHYEEGDYLTTGLYYLSYGTYDYEPIKNKDGSIVPSNYENFVIRINRDGTIDLNGVAVKYTIAGEYINLANGEQIQVADNNIFIYRVDGGVKYVAHDPFIKPEENKEDEEES